MEEINWVFSLYLHSETLQSVHLSRVTVSRWLGPQGAMFWWVSAACVPYLGHRMLWLGCPRSLCLDALHSTSLGFYFPPRCSPEPHLRYGWTHRSLSSPFWPCRVWNFSSVRVKFQTNLGSFKIFCLSVNHVLLLNTFQTPRKTKPRKNCRSLPFSSLPCSSWGKEHGKDSQLEWRQEKIYGGKILIPQNIT